MEFDPKTCERKLKTWLAWHTYADLNRSGLLHRRCFMLWLYYRAAQVAFYPGNFSMQLPWYCIAC
jgi:hypothetical protein